MTEYIIQHNTGHAYEAKMIEYIIQHNTGHAYTEGGRIVIYNDNSYDEMYKKIEELNQWDMANFDSFDTWDFETDGMELAWDIVDLEPEEKEAFAEYGFDFTYK